MKQTIIYFLKRIFVLTLLISIISYLYSTFLYEKTLKDEGWLKKIGTESFSKKAEILYFSASPNSSYSETDTDRRSIHEKIQSYISSYKIEALDTGAIHAGIFLHALKELPKEYKPKIVLMDLNLRSFGKLWIHSPLENSLQRNLIYWNNNLGLYNRLKAALKSYPYIPNHEREALINFDEKFEKLPFTDSCLTIKRWTDSLNHRLDHYDGIGREMVRNFGFKIKPDNEMLQFYNQIVSFCNANHIQLIFLVLPENYEGMEKNTGKNLKLLCQQNVFFLKQHFNKIPIIDLSNKLNATYFYETFPTEHYNSEGREIIAKKVGKFINQIQYGN